jgi:PAS domain S-box-containing protein
MPALIKSFDWSSTALGPIGGWPPSLRTIVGFLVRSPIPIVVLWGPDGVMIYNDKYSIFAGSRHPAMLGQDVRDGWPEVADFNAHAMRVGLAGGTLSYKDQELTLYRNGRAEQVWMNLDYSPVLGEDSRPAGVIAIVVETTERVIASRRIAAEQERQRQLFTKMPGFVCVLAGPSHVYEYVNDAYVQISGQRDFIGRSVREVFPDLAGQGYFELLDQVYATGEPVVTRARAIHLNGSGEPRFIDFVYQPIRDEQGGVIGIFCGGSDVTLSQQAAAALRASEERYRSLFESMGEGFCVIERETCQDGQTADYRYIAVNPAFAMVSGLKDVVGKTVTAVIPDVPKAILDGYDGVIATGQPIRFERELVAQQRVLELYAFRLEDGSNRRIGVISADVTARRRAEEARRDSERALQRLNETLEARIEEHTAQLLARETLIRTFFNHSSECHAVLVAAGDGSFRYEELNPATLRLYNKTREEVIGATTNEIFGAEAAAILNRNLAACLAGGVPYRYERLHGKQIVEAVATPVLHEAGPARRIVVSARDVTERRGLEEQLRQAQKMEAVGQLTGGIAHDFNNILAAISGSLELLDLRLAQGRMDGFERYISTAQDAARRAASLTQRLLAFSRRQTLDPKPTDVNRLVAEMQELIRHTVGPAVRLDVVAADGLWHTKVDPSQLESALLNLTINARDAMPGGGRLTLATANHWLDAVQAQERELQPGPYISLCVADTGTGMTPDVVAHAFDPFFTTKPIGQGTGLGLSMVHGFVRQSGGQVQIQSEPGRGTTICLHLPRFAGAPDSPDAAEPDTEAGPGRGETILIIDDEAAVRMLMVEVLEDAGYRTMEAADGAAGLKILQTDQRIDLLITDVGLPGGMNGRQVADAARQGRPELKILFVTGYAENAAVGNGTLAAGMQVITKPFSLSAFGNKVREIVEG